MSSLVEFARTELGRCDLFDKEGDFYGGMTGRAVLGLIEMFDEQGHSGMSASLVTTLFEKLSRFEPISPLTGEDEEWNETGEGHFQNKRCSHVFKEDGQAYDSNGKVFCKPDGHCYTGLGSRVDVTFPYTPKIEYVDVPGPEKVSTGK